MEQLLYISEAYQMGTVGYDEIITEDKNGNKITQIWLEGEFSEAERKNKNGRYYTESLMRRETAKLADQIRVRGGIGSALDHPMADPDDKAAIQAASIVKLDTCGALIKHMEMRGKKIYGKMVLLENDKGNTVKSMVRNGWKPGISSRGLGGKPTYESTLDAYIVPENEFSMVTYDMVSDPSSHNAILGAYFESQNRLLDHGMKYKRTMWDVVKSWEEK